MFIRSTIGTSLALAALLGLSSGWHVSATEKTVTTKNVICGSHDSFKIRRLNSDQADEICSTYKGKVMLVVNTASRCAYTDQYAGLEKLYENYREKGLVVIGFPSNDFGGQEPGTEKVIKNFCRLTYGVKFPMYAKTQVIGEGASPIYKALYRATDSTPRWNFHKYLIDRNGNVVENFGSSVSPENNTLTGAIERLL